jgi:hypothetical protein
MGNLQGETLVVVSDMFLPSLAVSLLVVVLFPNAFAIVDDDTGMHNFGSSFVAGVGSIFSRFDTQVMRLWGVPPQPSRRSSRST